MLKEKVLFFPAMKPSMNARGTLKDVANLVGVSHTTVSNAFSRPDQLSTELREQILAAARSLNYPGPNPAARMLRTGFAGTIAVVFGDPLRHAFQDPATSAFLSGVAEVCTEKGLGLLLLQGAETSVHTVQNAAVDGLIVYSMSVEVETFRAIKDRGLPTVIVDQPLIPKIPFVGIDDRAAARGCAEHLRDLGYARFAIVTFPLRADGHCGYVDERRLKGVCFEVPRRRIQGYLEILRSCEPKATFKIYECVRSDEEGGRVAAESLFKDMLRPAAVLATSDRLAIGIMETARAHRIRIPEDLAVVGFDDIPAASLGSPQLTTVHQPMQEKGRQAVSSLLNEKAPLRLKLPTKLMIRQSSALSPK